MRVWVKSCVTSFIDYPKKYFSFFDFVSGLWKFGRAGHHGPASKSDRSPDQEVRTCRTVERSECRLQRRRDVDNQGFDGQRDRRKGVIAVQTEISTRKCSTDGTKSQSLGKPYGGWEINNFKQFAIHLNTKAQGVRKPDRGQGHP